MKLISHSLVWALLTFGGSLNAASLVSTTSGNFGDPIWSGGPPAVPTSTDSFTVSNGHTVTAGESNVIAASGARVITCNGTLTIAGGASLVGYAGVNASSGIGVHTVNIAGGVLSSASLGSSTVAGMTFNVTGGLLALTTSTPTALLSTPVFNVSGGVFQTARSTSSMTINLSGEGTIDFTTGLTRWSSQNTWNGGTLVSNSNGTDPGGFSGMIGKFDDNSANIWKLSSKETRQSFYAGTSASAVPTQGTVAFNVYSPTDSDQIVSGGKIKFSTGVHFRITGLNLQGTTADYLYRTYNLLSFTGGYTGVTPIVENATWTIGGYDYAVTFANNIGTNGSVTVSSLTLLGEPVAVPFFTESFSNSSRWTSVIPSSGFNAGVAGSPDLKFRIRNGSGSLGINPVDRFASAYVTGGFQTSASGGFNPVLKNSTARTIEWSFAFGGSITSLTTPNLGGNWVNGTGDAIGIVVAASNPDIRANGQGYAVVISENRIKFVRYDGGLVGVVTELLGWTAADSSTESLHQIGGRTVHGVLSYEPATNRWQLKAGAKTVNLYTDSLPSPRSATYDSTAVKTVTDSAYVESALPQMAVFASTDDTVGQFYYDNLAVHLTLPPSQTATVSLTHSPGGTVLGDTTQTYEKGAKVLLDATPEEGYRFVGFSGDLTTRANSIWVPLVGNLAVHAIFEPVPVPAMTVGTNLTRPSDWSSSYPFSNLFSQMRIWTTVNVSGTTTSTTPIPVDADGWPNQIPFMGSNGIPQNAHTTLSAKLPESGGYLLDWDGEGTFKIDVRNDFVGGTRWVPTFVPGSTRPVSFTGIQGAGLTLTIQGASSSSHVRNIRIIRPGYASTYQTEPLHAELQSKLTEYGGSNIRFMDWQMTNMSPLVSWNQRPRPGSYVQSNGAAVEYMIAMCNLQHCDMWICIPHQADDNFILKLAQLIRYGSDGVNPYTSAQSNPAFTPLNPGLRVFVEYSNETWNTGFTQATYVANQGAALGYGPNAGDKYTTRRSVQIWEIFDSVFSGLEDRVVRVLAGMSAGFSSSQRRIDALSDPNINPNRTWPDAFAIAPYYGRNYSGNDIATEGYPDLADLVAYSDSDIENNKRAEVQNHWNMCRKTGLDLVCYEGGQHFSGLYSMREDPTLSSIFYSYYLSQEIYNDYFDYMDMLKEEHVSLFVHFTFVDRYNPGVANWWPILNEVDSPASESPRYKAILDWMALNPIP